MKVIDSTGIDVGPATGTVLPLAALTACGIVELGMLNYLFALRA
jgi:hypothetical protein